MTGLIHLCGTISRRVSKVERIMLLSLETQNNIIFQLQKSAFYTNNSCTPVKHESRIGIADNQISIKNKIAKIFIVQVSR